MIENIPTRNIEIGRMFIVVDLECSFQGGQ
jgi:hypothetical protein